MIKRIVVMALASPFILAGIVARLVARFFQFGLEIGDDIIKSLFEITGTVSGS